MALASFSTGIIISSSPTRVPFFQDRITFTTTVFPSHQFASFSDTVVLKASLRTRQQPLANNRSNAFTTK